MFYIFSLISLLGLCFSLPVKRDGVFTLKVLSPGSSIHTSTVSVSGSSLVLGSNMGLFTMEDGFLKDFAGNSFDLSPEFGHIQVSDQANNEFGSTENGQFLYMTHNGILRFIACPLEGLFTLAVGSCEGGIPVSLMIQN